jgi:hypothetical protein
LPPRLSRAPDRGALNLVRELRQHGFRVEMRVRRGSTELHINMQALLVVVPARQLNELHVARLQNRLQTEGWAAGLLVTFESARPRSRRLLNPAVAREDVASYEVSNVSTQAAR